MTLEEVIADELHSGMAHTLISDGHYTAASKSIANAVRAFLGSEESIEKAARAISAARDLNPECLYEHHEWEEWPTDQRDEYVDAISGERRVRLSHRAWRRHSKSARAALSSIGGE